MCGRYALAEAIHLLNDFFDIDITEVEDLPPAYNIAPSSRVPIIRQREHGARELALARWGLVPHWADDPTIGYRMINARSETAHTKPAFRDALAHRRCIVPITGFYEWQRTERRKQPWYFVRADRCPMALAGLWETWRSPDGQALQTCTILTTHANEVVSPVHDRMPVVMNPPTLPDWLDPATTVTDARKMLHPAAPQVLTTWPVSPRVNKPQNDDAQLIAPLDETDGQLPFA